MGDVLPLKRETVVDRLRLRLEQYRWHHKSSLHRYEQNANSLNEKQRQDTIRLKQKFLESNAKKAKNNKADHHRASAAARDAIPDTQKLLTHPKPVTKIVGEASPANSSADLPTEETDRKATLPEKTATDSTKEQSKPQNFPLKIAPQFKKNNKASHSPSLQSNKSSLDNIKQVAASPASQNPPLAPTQTLSQNVSNLNHNRSNPADGSCIIECKREVDNVPDICQFKENPESCTGSDRLSDTFPSIGFAEDSGDDIIHPDILKNLIDDVFTNSADIMKDFNFEDAMDSLKDGGKDEISELVKGATAGTSMHSFQSENLIFSGHSLNSEHQAGPSVFETSSAPSSSTNIPSMAATATTTTASATNTVMYRSHQGMTNFSNTNNMGLPSGINLDFKLSEPSPAALTLKQMAEQHQNMQQKQLQLNSNMNSPFNMRNQFSMNSFPDSVGNFGTRFVGGTSEQQRTQNPVMYQPMSYDISNNFPGVVPLQNNNVFKQEACVGVRPSGTMIGTDASKNRLLSVAQTSNEKKMPCINQEGMNFYVANASNQQHLSPSQYVGNVSPNVQLQMRQNQQLSPAIRSMHVSSAEMKPTESIHTQYSNMYAYNSQQANSPMFNIPQNSHYNTSYNMAASSSRPPPEYKIPELNNRPANIAMNQARHQTTVPYQQVQQQPSSNTWWTNQQQQNLMTSDLLQQQDGYANLNCTGPIPSSISHSTMHHPYRTVGQMSSGKTSGITNLNHSMMQNLQVNTLPQHCASSNNIEMNIGNNSGLQMYGGYSDLGNRPGNQINLDFLDSMESSASDLLNFDQVMQNAGTTHFQLLDDMDMLTK